MSTRRSLFILYFITLCISLSALTFIIDGSGSMKGFSKTGAIKKQVEEIAKLKEGDISEDRIILFISKTADSIELQDINLTELNDSSLFNGKFTLLGKMAQEVFNSIIEGNYVIISDNVEDDITTRGDSRVFYNKLMESQSISSVDIIPRFHSFRGNPCRSTLKNYDGAAGLLVYFINVGSHKKEIFQRNQLVNNLRETGYPIFHIKPINSNHIKLTSPRGSKGSFEIYSQNGRYHLRIISENKTVPTLQIDKLNRIKFSIIMQSFYDYIGIQKDTSVKISNFAVHIAGLPVKIQEPVMKISPAILPEHLEKGGMQRFDAEIILKPLEQSLRQRIMAMFHPQRCQVSFDLVLGTSENSIYMVEAARKQYFTTDISVYDKIYSNVDMISYFNPQDNKIVFHVSNEDNSGDIRTQIKLMYDNMGLFLLLLGIICLLATLGIFLYYWIQSPRFYTVTIEKNRTGEKDVRIMGKFSSFSIESCTIRRGLSRVIISLNDKDKYYFKDSIFLKIDLPLKIQREVIERATSEIIKIYMDINRRDNE
jgi:hypothetical protein